jgi:hypothetical protein
VNVTPSNSLQARASSRRSCSKREIAALPDTATVPSTRLAVPVLLIETVFGVREAGLVEGEAWCGQPAAGVGAAAPLPVRLSTLVFGDAVADGAVHCGRRWPSA